MKSCGDDTAAANSTAGAEAAATGGGPVNSDEDKNLETIR